MSEENKRQEQLTSLRNSIRLRESNNAKRKNPKKDSEMVEEIIKLIKDAVDKETLK